MKKQTKLYQKQQPKRTSLLPRFIILGLVVLVSLALYFKMSALQDAFSLSTPTTKVSAAENDASTTPTFLRIPDIDFAAVISDSDDTTSYTLKRYTTQAKQVMHTYIIFNNTNDSGFSQISSLQIGDTALLVTEDGNVHTYTVTQKFSATFPQVLLFEDNALYLTTKPLFPFMKKPVIKALEEK